MTKSTGSIRLATKDHLHRKRTYPGNKGIPFKPTVSRKGEPGVDKNDRVTVMNFEREYDKMLFLCV